MFIASYEVTPHHFPVPTYGCVLEMHNSSELVAQCLHPGKSKSVHYIRCSIAYVKKDACSWHSCVWYDGRQGASTCIPKKPPQ